MTALATDRRAQRCANLLLASEIHSARAALGRQIAAGTVSVAHVLLAPPPCVRSCAVDRLLMYQRRWGADRASKLLGRLEIRENKPVGDLTERQRWLLSEALR